MKGSTRDWYRGLLERLKDPAEAAAYLNASFQEGLPFPVALGDAVRAHGITKIAQKTRLAKQNVIRALRPNSNPTLKTLVLLLHSVGLELSVRALEKKPKKKSKR